MINIAWKAATCVQFYNISVDGSVVATTTELSYNYTFRDVDIFNFEVISIGYTGNIVGVLSETFHWERKVMMMCIFHCIVFSLCF